MSVTFRSAARVGCAAAICAALAIIGGGRFRVRAAPAQAPSTPAASQQPPANQPGSTDQQGSTDQPPTFRAGVNFIRVDAIVTDKSGAVVSDLKPEDFEVTEQGKAQKIETFKLVSLDGGLMATGADRPQAIRSEDDERREAAKDDVRLFAIFLDDYHVKRESSLGARRQIAQFIDTQLGPSDMIGVMYPLEPLDSVLMTRNHDSVKQAIERFVGRKFDYTPMNPMEERYVHAPTETVEQIRNNVSLGALRGLIMHMGTLKEGRKALILVSEGYSGLVPPQLRDADASNPGSGNPNRFNPSAGADVGDLTEQRAQNQAESDMEMRLRDVYEDANHYNVSIYAVDPRMLATNEFGIDMPTIDQRVDRQYLNSTINTLQTLAEQTDGRAIVNTNQLAIGMKQIVKDSSAYYLLGYNSSFTTPDGKFHEIKVKVKRPGVQVRARKGYWALNREEAAIVKAPPKPSPPTRVQEALTALGAASVRERVVRTWFGTEKGENGKTRVTFVWEPVPQAPGSASRRSDQPTRVSVIAAAADGTPYFRGRVPDSPPAGGAAASAGGRVSFDVPPGPMELHLSVEGSGGVLDSETREVPVPDLTGPQTVLSTPEIFRARTPREMQQVKADPQAMPTVGREFARADRLLVRVAAYGPGAAPPKLAAKLLSRGGKAMADLPISQPQADQPAQIELPLSNLAAGDYLIEIDANGDGGTAQELVGFRVTG